MRSTVLRIETAALENNARIIKKALGNVRYAAVVKADAYGHGLVEASRAFLAGGADYLAVAIAEEAVTLRDSGIDAPILILGAAEKESLDDIVSRGVSQTVFDVPTLRALSAAAKKTGRQALAHLKIDTGMSRIGVKHGDALEKLLEIWKGMPEVRMEGIFTHFCVSESDEGFTRLQARRFEDAAARVRAAGFDPIRHAAATGAFMNSEYRYDMVRPGIAGYGLCPLPGARFAQTLVTNPVRIERIRSGESVSYGRTFTAERDTVVMTLPIGYGDGYRRAFSNKAQALIRGKRVDQIGRVCMDMTMFDITGIDGASLDDEVVLLGSQGNETITPVEAADLIGTIPYEIMLSFSPRVRREYI